MKKVLDFVKNFVLNFIKTRTVAYYIASAAAFIAWVAGIVCTAALGFAGATIVPFTLVSLGGLAFIVGSLFGHERIGAAFVAAGSYGAFVAMFCEVFPFFLSKIQEQGMTGFDIAAIPGIGALIACVIMFIVCAVAANVLAFLKLNKQTKQSKPDTQTEEENKTEVATDEAN